jgi:ABC-type uncharacterized transport system permease subunit
MHFSLSIAAAFVYGISAFLAPHRQTAVSLLAIVGWVLHGASIWFATVEPTAIRIGFAAMLSATLWISVAAYWLESRNLPLDGLRVLVMPCAAIAVILPVLFPGEIIVAQNYSPVFAWHIAISILAYSTLTIAAFHAILMALQEARLHSHHPSTRFKLFGAVLDRLPALLTMEKLLFRLIAFGFVLLTLTVLSGVIFSEQIFGKAFQWSHKIIFALLSWGLFGLLLAGRLWRGWRGRTALGFTLTGFATLLLAYVGTRFVLEVVLHRGIA